MGEAAEKRTEMVAPQAPAKTRLVKIKALSAIMTKPGEITPPGSVVEVTEDVAHEFCDKQFHGYYSFGGERSVANSPRHVMVRAERVH